MNRLQWSRAWGKPHLVYSESPDMSVCGKHDNYIGAEYPAPDACKTCAKHWFALWAQNPALAKYISGYSTPESR